MIVFTNGCFDILHAGHIDYLEKSRELGDKLIVGINSDASVRRLKGSGRPINNELDRRRMLEALSCVDEVHIFDETTPYNLIALLRPDIITKGGDYKPEDVVGKDLAKVVVLPYVKNKSTTRIIEHASRAKRLGSRGNMGSERKLLWQEFGVQSWNQIFHALSRGQR